MTPQQTILCGGTALLLLLQSGCALVGPRAVGHTAGAASPFDLTALGISYDHLVRTDPRPLHIHRVRIDLRAKAICPAVVVASDPDAEGPAEASLTSPFELAAGADALLLVNTNPWRRPPGAARSGAPWLAGEAVDICGLAKTAGAGRSQPEKGRQCFWFDRSGNPHLGTPAEHEDMTEGGGGFGPLLQNGRVMPPETDTVCHPRTAIGLDGERHTLTLVVVDGRNPGVSEGVSTRELALLLQEFGCRDAINLDGGGSSILILAQPDGTRRAVNHPSDHVLGVSVPRPIPAALVFRRR